jgi:hypothetical protein
VSPRVVRVRKTTASRMRTPIFVIPSILKYPTQSNTDGRMATRLSTTQTTDRCGGRSARRAPPDLRIFWRKGSQINGIMLTMLRIGTSQRFVSNKFFKTHGISKKRLVFRWLAIPWLQKEADSYMYRNNTSRRRASLQKMVPNGIPDVIYENPETVDALDYKARQHCQLKALNPHTGFHRSPFRTP